MKVSTSKLQKKGCLVFGYVVLAMFLRNPMPSHPTAVFVKGTLPKRFKPPRRLASAQNAQTNGRATSREHPKGPVCHERGYTRGRNALGGSPVHHRDPGVYFWVSGQFATLGTLTTRLDGSSRLDGLPTLEELRVVRNR